MPDAPFCTSAEVALLHYQLVKPLFDFEDGVTNPGKTQVDTMITLVSNRLLNRFRHAGYIIPLSAITDETWPEDQTQLLKWGTMAGVSAMISGPFQSNPGVRGERPNPLQREFDSLLDDIFNRATGVSMPFRAQYYSGTPAEKAIGEMAVPRTDWMDQKYDPWRHYSFQKLTDKLYSIQKVMEDMDLEYNYIYGLHDQEPGLARSADEV